MRISDMCGKDFDVKGHPPDLETQQVKGRQILVSSGAIGGGEQGYTAGRNYMFLAVTIWAWPQLFVPGRNYLFLFAENVKKFQFKYYLNHPNPQYLSSYLIIQLQVRELFLLVLNLVQSVPLKCLQYVKTKFLVLLKADKMPGRTLTKLFFCFTH